MQKKKPRRNDDDRESWVINDEGLYRLQRLSGLSVGSFVRRYRSQIDGIIDKVESRGQHYVCYGKIDNNDVAFMQQIVNDFEERKKGGVSWRTKRKHQKR